MMTSLILANSSFIPWAAFTWTQIIYTDPSKFDPESYIAGREKKEFYQLGKLLLIGPQVVIPVQE